ncbi:MAG: hypothetical protein ABL901_09135 [Hyphomicrobiaceae bacterium]
MGDASIISAYLPWLWIAVFFVVCELAKALHKTGKQLAATKADLAGTTAALARVRADRDLADAALRRAVNAPQQRDQTGNPFALATWQPESKPS